MQYDANYGYGRWWHGWAKAIISMHLLKCILIVLC